MKLVAAASAVALVACSADEGALPSAPDAAPDAEHADAEARDAATRDASQAPDAAPDAGPPVVPDIDAIAWNAGPSVGYGVAAKDSGNPAGESMFVAYAGYNVALDGAKAWATAPARRWCCATRPRIAQTDCIFCSTTGCYRCWLGWCCRCSE